MTSSTSLLSSLLFPVLGGIVLGFVAGVFSTLYWIGHRREQGRTVPIYRDPVDPETGESVHPQRIPVRSGDHFSVLGWVLLVLSVAGLVAGCVSIFQTTAQAQCLSEFVASNAAATRVRSEVATTDRQGVREVRQVNQEFYRLMVDAVTHPVTDPAAQAKAREAFVAKARDWDARLAEVDRLDREAERQRQANPLPAQPVC